VRLPHRQSSSSFPLPPLQPPVRRHYLTETSPSRFELARHGTIGVLGPEPHSSPTIPGPGVSRLLARGCGASASSQREGKEGDDRVAVIHGMPDEAGGRVKEITH